MTEKTMLHTHEQVIYTHTFKRDLFDRICRTYNIVNNFSTFGLPILFRKINLRQLRRSVDAVQVLDLMSGAGENWSELFKIFPFAKITAIDVSGKMSEKAKFKIKRYPKRNIDIITEDFFEVPLKSESFDVVICSFGLKCINKDQNERLALLVRRVLKKNGQFAMIETTKPDNYLMRSLITVNFKYLLPLIGKIFSKSSNDYEMLWTYLDNYDQEEVTQVFIKNGFHVNVQKRFFGCVTTTTNF